eukprot:369724-Amphidinium_carterae.1
MLIYLVCTSAFGTNVQHRDATSDAASKPSPLHDELLLRLAWPVVESNHQDVVFDEWLSK